MFKGVEVISTAKIDKRFPSVRYPFQRLNNFCRSLKGCMGTPIQLSRPTRAWCDSLDEFVRTKPITSDQVGRLGESSTVIRHINPNRRRPCRHDGEQVSFMNQIVSHLREDLSHSRGISSHDMQVINKQYENTTSGIISRARRR